MIFLRDTGQGDLLRKMVGDVVHGVFDDPAVFFRRLKNAVRKDLDVVLESVTDVIDTAGPGDGQDQLLGRLKDRVRIRPAADRGAREQGAQLHDPQLDLLCIMPLI